MDGINFTPFPVLATDRLLLRQIEMEDMNEFFLLKSDERLLSGYDAKSRSYEEAISKLRELNEDIDANVSITWGITRKNENRLIGSVCFWNIFPLLNKAEIGYELMTDWQGKGIMREAVKKIIDFGFGVMGLKVIEAVLNPDNLQSVKLLEINGFTGGTDLCAMDVSCDVFLKRRTYTLNVFDYCAENIIGQVIY